MTFWFGLNKLYTLLRTGGLDNIDYKSLLTKTTCGQTFKSIKVNIEELYLYSNSYLCVVSHVVHESVGGHGPVAGQGPVVVMQVQAPRPEPGARPDNQSELSIVETSTNQSSVLW